jgi:hypothetical protein
MADTLNVADANAESDAINRRRFPRTSVLWPGQLNKPDGRSECMIFNLSAGGAKVRVDESIELNTDLTLRVGQFGEFCGTVVWKAKNLLGISFTTNAREVGARLGGTLPALA